MMIVKASAVGLLEDSVQLADLLEFHDVMVNAGVVVSVEALQPVSRGVRVRYTADRRTIVDDPLPQAEQHIVGFWLIHVHSVDEAIEWARRLPLVGGEVEVRRTAFQLLPVH